MALFAGVFIIFSTLIVHAEGVDVRVGDPLNYPNGYSYMTHYFYINDHLAYCLQPRLGPMPNGGYEATEISSEGYEGYPLLVKVLACGYGGPNDLTSIYFPNASEQERYIYTHIAAGYAYVSNRDVNSSIIDITGLSNEDFENCGLGAFVRAAWNTEYRGTIKIVRTEGYQDIGYLASYYLPTWTVRVNKTDNNGAKLQGAIFGVYSDEGCNNLIKEMPATDGNGYSETELESGYSTVYVKEISAPNGYLRDKNIYTMNPDNTTINVSNNQALGKISVYKRDARTNEVPQGDASFEGAIFGLYARENIINPANGQVKFSQGSLVGNITTDARGYGEINNVLPGKYFVKETKAPRGYQINNESYNVDVNYVNQDTQIESKSLTISDEVYMAPLEINKTKTGNADVKIQGAGFSVYLKSKLSKKADGTYDFASASPVSVNSDRSTIMFTDEYGVAKSIPLPYGTYVVTETVVPKNFKKANDFEITISENGATTGSSNANITDDAFKIKFRINKIDEDSKALIRSSEGERAVFDIYDVNAGDYALKDLEVNGEGYLVTPIEFEAGEYRIEEKNSPTGYLKNENGITVSIDEDCKKTFDSASGEEVFEINFPNKAVKGGLEIEKSGEKLNGFTPADKGSYVNSKFNYELTGLENVEFEIYALEDIYLPDGSVDGFGERVKAYEKDELIGKIVTDENGKASFKDDESPLYFGNYYVVESDCSKGFLKSNDKHEFAIDGEDKSNDYTETLEITNVRQKFEVSVLKVDSSTAEPLEGAKFRLFAKEDIVLDDLTVSEGEILAYSTSDKNGKALFEIDLVEGKYGIEEIEAPDGYVLSDEIIEVILKYEADDGKHSNEENNSIEENNSNEEKNSDEEKNSGNDNAEANQSDVNSDNSVINENDFENKKNEIIKCEFTFENEKEVVIPPKEDTPEKTSGEIETPEEKEVVEVVEQPETIVVKTEAPKEEKTTSKGTLVLGVTKDKTYRNNYRTGDINEDGYSILLSAMEGDTDSIFKLIATISIIFVMLLGMTIFTLRVTKKETK